MFKRSIKTRLPYKVRSLITSANTFINPTNSLTQLVQQTCQSLASPKSLLITVTSNHASQLHAFITQNPIKCPSIIGVACDAIPFGCQRNAISLMTCDTKMPILDSIPLDNKTNINSKSGRTNWELTSSYLSADLIDNDTKLKKHDFTVPLANTLFETGIESHLIVNDPTFKFSGQFLSALKIGIEDTWNSQLKSHVSLQPLAGYNEILTVTSAAQNMIKTINDRPAASFLQSNPLLSKPQGDLRERKVFMEILSSDLQPSRRFEVVAGGGETWSPRSSMLVVEAPAVLKPGDRIRFSLTTGIFTAEQYASSPYPSFIKNATNPQICLECAPVLETASDPNLVKYSSDTHLVNQFGLASEKGFTVNDLNHQVSGETVTLIRS